MKNENKRAEFAIELLALLAILFLIWGATACKKQIVQGETIYKEIRVTNHDTTIVTEADSASLRALLYCDSAYNVVLGDLEMSEGERLNLEWKIGLIMGMNNRQVAQFEVDCKEDSLVQEIAWRDSTIISLTERNIVQYVRQRNAYDKATSAGFWVLLSILIGIVAINLIRIYKRYKPI